MAAAIRYGSAREAAHAVRDELVAQGRKPMSVRPYSFQRPDTSVWWTFPSSDWPAYQHAKLFFDPPEKSAGLVFCGLYVEKGLDPKVASVVPAGGKKYLMDRKWLWHRLLADLGSPTFHSACSAVSVAVDSPLLVEVQSSYVLDRDESDDDEFAPSGERDVVVFEVTGKSELRLHETPDLPVRILNGLAKSTTLAALAESLRSLPRGDFAWVDFFVGSNYEVGRFDGWDASELWSKALSAWEPWFG